VIRDDAFASQPATSVEPTNYSIFKDFSRQDRNDTSFTEFDEVSSSVDDGVVILSGKVTMPFKRNDIERRVTRVAGVKQVVNQIDVLPVSQFDEELRFRIARAIYGNPNFWHYASMANPPIHIVVEHGRVTLSVSCRTNRAHAGARSLARHSGPSR
jgi:hyperosmotically inducible protein